MSKLLLFSAPSGAGKTTIVNHLLDEFEELAFSVSATTRDKRAYEVEGKDYYFISSGAFRKLIKKGAFVEWEEVYENQFYGTLKSEIERLWAEKKHIIFDIDVKGAYSIKKTYPEQSLSVFIKPLSTKVLFDRLKKRKTESEASLKKRIAKVAEELTYEDKSDLVLINDDLNRALQKAEEIVKNFING